MHALPIRCRDRNSVGSFCDCIKEDPSADVAAQALCKRADAGGNVTGDDVVELKKALMDLEGTDEEGCSGKGCSCGC